MRVQRLFVITICLFIFPVVSSAQIRNQKVDIGKALKPSKVNNIVSLLGLDPQKFSMNHSYSLSFGSMGGHGYNSGLYLNRMTYQFSEPLTLYFQVGVQHHPLGNKVGNTTLQNQMFVSGAGLQYKPFDNFSMHFEYSQTPASMSYGSPFRAPISRNRAWLDQEINTED